MRKPESTSWRVASASWLPILIWIGVCCGACSAGASCPRGADCTPAAAPGTAASPATQTPPLVTDTAAEPTLKASATPASTSTAAMIPTSAPPSPDQICAPFPNYSRADLQSAISNPFNPPPPGSDDPHQGLDLAVIQSGMAVTGGPVQAVLEGRVALLVYDRFPYGNAVLVETPLASLPDSAPWGSLIPTVAPTLPPHPALTCPAVELLASSGSRSLYILYAHLGEISNLEIGQPLTCGADIGRVGQSGNALNPHLHLEARIGPSGMQLGGMAHYEPRATAGEMAGYCLWRVSNLFQLIDPSEILSQIP